MELLSEPCGIIKKNSTHYSIMLRYNMIHLTSIINGKPKKKTKRFPDEYGFTKVLVKQALHSHKA